MRKIINNVLDYSNICFVQLGIGFFNCMIFYPGTWMFLTFYFVFLLVNIFCCYIIVTIKRHSIEKVLEGCDRNVAELSEDPHRRTEVDKALRKNIQWGDIAELAFGRIFGRFLTETSLLLFLLTSGTAQMAAIRLLGALSFSTSTKTMNNRTESFGIENYDKLFEVKTTAMYAVMGLFFMLSCAFTRYRYLGIFSLVGFVIIYAENLKIANLTVNLNSISFDYVHPSGANDSYQSFVFQSCGPQIAGMMLTIHNNMYDNEQHFAATVCVGAILAAFVIIVIGASLVFLPYYGPGIPFPSVIIWHCPDAWKVTLLIGYLFFFFLLNIPLFDLLERWLSFCICHKAVFEDPAENVRIRRIQDTPVDLFTPDQTKKSVFGQLNDDRDSVLRSSQVIGDVKKKVPIAIRGVLRVLTVVLQWAGGLLIWGSATNLEAFAIFQTVSTLFSGFVAPFLLYLRLLWGSAHIVNKLLCVLIIIGAITWNVIAYGKVHLITNLF